MSARSNCSDATLLLEHGPDGKGNWVMGAPKADEEDEAEEEPRAGGLRSPSSSAARSCNNVRLIYREAKKPDRVAQLDKLSIAPGPGGICWRWTGTARSMPFPCR